MKKSAVFEWHKRLKEGREYMKYVEGLSVQQLIERAKIGSFANSSPEHDVLTICFPFSKKTNDKVGPSASLDRFATLRNFV